MPDVNLAGHRILLVEDEYLIGFNLRNELLDCDAEVIGPIGDLDAAFAVVDTEPRLDAAVLDVNLRGELAFSLADHLVRHDVPFVFATGYGVEVIPYRLQHIIRYEKPVRSGRIARLVASMLPLTGVEVTPACDDRGRASTDAIGAPFCGPN